MTASEVYRLAASEIRWGEEPEESDDAASIENVDDILAEETEITEYPVDKKGRPIPPPPKFTQLIRRKKKK